MKGPSTGFMTLKNLDDFETWPIRHRHWSFEVVEDEAHDLWINTRDLRSFYPALPKDAALKTSYLRTSLFVKAYKALYISERAMRMELRKSKGRPEHTDVLKFLEWFEKNLSQVAAKKRLNRKLDDANAIRDDESQHIHLGSIPRAIAPTQLEATTILLDDKERWLLESHAQELPKVFRPEALPIRSTWRGWARNHGVSASGYWRSFFRGERNFFLTIAFCVLLAFIPGRVQDMMLPASLDWTRASEWILWSFALIVPVALTTAIGVGIALTRSMLQSVKKPAGLLWAGGTYFFVIGLAPAILTAFWEQDMLDNWWAMVRGAHHPVAVSADPFLGRIVVKGAFKFGSADALQFALDRNPKMSLVEIESPGGFVLEGLRMAQMINDRKMDTVSMEGCYSACTLLLAAGKDRYLGPDVEVGFHRSGTRYGPVSTGRTSTDEKMAEFLKKRGVDTAFIDKALIPSIREIWTPEHGEMFSAGYATLKWSERKAPY
jgi:hypothetical protein